MILKYIYKDNYRMVDFIKIQCIRPKLKQFFISNELNISKIERKCLFGYAIAIIVFIQ